MTRTQTGDAMIDDKREEKSLIKIFDEDLAATLVDGGFSYMKEKINGFLDVFVFEDNDEIRKFLDGISMDASCFSEIDFEMTFDDALRF